MRLKSGVTVLLVAGIFAGGCGGGSKPKPSGPSDAQADASAKTAARTAATEMEACFVDSQSYADCKPRAAASDVSEATASGYKLTVDSSSGNKFVIEKTDSGVKRTCTTRGKDGCPDSGAW